MSETLQLSCLISLGIVVGLPLIGFIIGFIINLFYKVLANIVGSKFAYFLVNYFVFIGVVHHELSHALLLILTGAKITHISLFRPDGTNLGKVEFCTRGGKIRQALQLSLSAVAPMLCGAVTSYVLIYVLTNINLSFWVTLLLWYTVISIILHMTMSKLDLKNYFRGSPFLFLIVSFVLYYFVVG